MAQCPISNCRLVLNSFSESSQDEYGTAAYKTVECDDSKVILPCGLGIGLGLGLGLGFRFRVRVRVRVKV